jgi:hypothetical protein
MEVLYRLKENERLLLDDPEKVWVAIGGKLDLLRKSQENTNLSSNKVHNYKYQLSN